MSRACTRAQLLLMLVLVSGAFCGHAVAQVFSPSLGNLTSTQNIRMSLPDLSCGATFVLVDNPYRIETRGNQIIVRLGKRSDGAVSICPAPRLPLEDIDLGRLLPGDYTISVYQFVGTPVFENLPITVRDGRANKVAPYVRMDYSGTWWDSADPGWGLFVWQDHASPRDEMLAAWFGFGADGKPIWYTFAPTWRTSTATNLASLVQSSRVPGAAALPPGPNSAATVGNASLDFSSSVSTDAAGINTVKFDQAVLTYSFTGGATQTRTLKRFKP
jgi:hypothetical protein